MDIARELIKKKKFKIKRVCDVIGIARSNIYAQKNARPKRYKMKDDPVVLKSILEETRTRSTYGYPRVTALINRKRRQLGQKNWNKKRVLRVMQMNNLVLEKHHTKPKRLHLGQVMTIRSNVRWCSDIFEIKCWNGEKVFVAFSLDCHDREVMSFKAERRPLFHGDIINLIDQTVTNRFGEYVLKLPHQIEWLTDQGPQYKSLATVQYGQSWGFKMITTPAYSPQSNGMAEAFVKLFKRDYVYVNELWTAESVLRSLPDWFLDYNKNHPHSSLKMMSPKEYRKNQKEIEIS